MAEDNDFDQIVEKIRNAITIPTLGLDNYYGTLYSFGIFNTNSNGEPTLSPYAGKEDRLWNDKNMKTVKDHYPEAVNLTNWRNISFLQTYYNYFKNNDIPKENRLPLKIQGVSNEVVSSLTPPFHLKFLRKNEWVEHLNNYLLKTIGTTGKAADNYFLFFPDADIEIRPQSMNFTDNYFGIFCVRWVGERKEWLYESWYFKTPTKQQITRPELDADGYLKPYNSGTQEFFCEDSFPLRNFRRSQDDYKDASDFWMERHHGNHTRNPIWDNGENFAVNGGGFYLGQDAKPFLDLFPKTKPEPAGFGVFNWWW